jgi:hypothetical protein
MGLFGFLLLAFRLSNSSTLGSTGLRLGLIAPEQRTTSFAAPGPAGASGLAERVPMLTPL